MARTNGIVGVDFRRGCGTSESAFLYGEKKERGFMGGGRVSSGRAESATFYG